MKVLGLIPMPMVRRREVVQVRWDLRHSRRRMRRLDLQHAFAIGWPFPSCSAKAVVLLKSVVLRDLTAADVETALGGDGHDGADGDFMLLPLVFDLDRTGASSCRLEMKGQKCDS